MLTVCDPVPDCSTLIPLNIVACSCFLLCFKFSRRSDELEKLMKAGFEKPNRKTFSQENVCFKKMNESEALLLLQLVIYNVNQNLKLKSLFHYKELLLRNKSAIKFTHLCFELDGTENCFSDMK